MHAGTRTRAVPISVLLGAHPNAARSAFAKNKPFSSKLKFALNSSRSEEKKPIHRVCEESNYFFVLAKTFRHILILPTQILG